MWLDFLVISIFVYYIELFLYIKHYFKSVGKYADS
jgi:hypothetical protein